MKRRLQIVKEGFETVFRHSKYLFAAAVFSFATFLFAIWLPNLELLKEVLFSATFSFSSKVTILYTSLWNIQSNFHGFGRTVLLLISILFGVNAAMVIFYLKKTFRVGREAGSGILGTIFGMLGVGCASCGSVIASALFGTALVGVLPFRGLEFGVIGIGFLVFSIYLASRKIVMPNVCKIEL